MSLAKPYTTILILIIGFTFSSCREAVKLKSSVRKTETETRLFKNAFNKVKRGIGVDKIETLADNDTIGDSSIYAPMSQKNMLNTYGYIYDFINSSEQPIRTRGFAYDSTNNRYLVKDKNYKSIKEGKEVFGWHPYWMNDSWKSYPFELLTTISYFSYKIDPNSGSYTNQAQIDDWNTTTMIDSALTKQTRVLLTASCHGFRNTSEFLDNPDRWGEFIDTIEPLILDRNANGLDINFESLSYFYREKFNLFVAEVHKRLSTSYASEGKAFFLSITLPAYDSREIFDIKTLETYADLMVIMGYDYNTGTQTQGPVAPLRSKESSISLSTTLDFYIDRGINLDKTVLALPYYGAMWDGTLTKNGDATYNETTLERKLTYAEIKKLLIDNSKYNTVPILDEYSMTNYYNLTYKDNSTKEIWYDDEFTLSQKYQYAMSKDLKGIGVWALGYDNGYNNLWNVIEDEFATDIKVYKNPIALAEGYPIKISSFLLKYNKLFVTAAVVFFIAIALSFFVLLTDWRVRDSILQRKLYQWIFIIISFILILPLTAMLYLGLNEILPAINLFIKPEWQIYIAFILGMILLYIIQKLKVKSIERP